MGIKCGGWIDRIGCWGPAIKIGRIGINHPFGHIAIDIVQTPGVGFFKANGLRTAPTVGSCPGMVGQGCRIVAKVKALGRTCPCGVLPLRFGREAVENACFQVEPVAVLNRTILGHAHGWLPFFSHAKGHV